MSLVQQDFFSAALTGKMGVDTSQPSSEQLEFDYNFNLVPAIWDINLVIHGASDGQDFIRVGFERPGIRVLSMGLAMCSEISPAIRWMGIDHDGGRRGHGVQNPPSRG